jgi:hypothetical protein
VLLAFKIVVNSVSTFSLFLVVSLKFLIVGTCVVVTLSSDLGLLVKVVVVFVSVGSFKALVFVVKEISGKFFAMDNVTTGVFPMIVEKVGNVLFEIVFSTSDLVVVSPHQVVGLFVFNLVCKVVASSFDEFDRISNCEKSVK